MAAPAELKRCTRCGSEIAFDPHRASVYAQRRRCSACGRGRPTPLRPIRLRQPSPGWRLPAVFTRPYTAELWLPTLRAQVKLTVNSAASHLELVDELQTGCFRQAQLLRWYRYTALLTVPEAA